MDEDPRFCSICRQPLHRMKHATAHEQAFTWDAEIRTCPHNLYSAHRYDQPRHDEWHKGMQGWTRREG